MRTRRAIEALLATLFPFVIGCGDDGGGEPPPPPPTMYTGAIDYVATHYDVALDLASRQNKVDVTLHTSKDGDCATINMRTPTANAVTLNGIAAKNITFEGGKLTACDGAGLGWPAGSDVILSATTEVPFKPETSQFDVGFSRRTDEGGGTFSYMVSWLNGCDLHGPCDARPNAFATYRFVISHDDTTQVLCPGKLTETPTQTTCDFTYGGPSYSTYGFMARSPAWTRSSLGTWGDGVVASLYDHAGSQVAARFDGAQIGGQFAWMADHFGPYAYGQEIRFATAPTYWAGFEHPGNIALGDWLGASNSAYADGLQHTVMHEIVHQWAGDQATLASTYDFVWKEAMAEYLTFVYEDEHLGGDVGEKSATYWKAVAPRSRYHLVPEDQPRPELGTYYGDVYGPGPMILFRQLEVMFGRDKILDALVELIGTGAPRALAVTDVQAALEQATGADLDKYFAAWVYGSGPPAWPVATAFFEESQQTPGSWTVRVATTTSDGVARGCAFHVRLLGAGGEAAGEFADFLVSSGPDGGEYPTPAAVPLTWTPVSVVLDPDHECLVYSPAMLTAPVPDFFWAHSPDR